MDSKAYHKVGRKVHRTVIVILPKMDSGNVAGSKKDRFRALLYLVAQRLDHIILCYYVVITGIVFCQHRTVFTVDKVA